LLSTTWYGGSTGTAASSVTASLTTPTITWTPASTIIFGSSGATTVLTASANGVSGEGVWIVDGAGGISELAGNGAIASSADPGLLIKAAMSGQSEPDQLCLRKRTSGAPL